MEVIRPEIEGRIPFLIASNPLPWSFDCGEVVSVAQSTSRIKVKVKVDEDAFKSLPRYDHRSRTSPVRVTCGDKAIFEVIVNLEQARSSPITLVLQES